MSLRKSSKSAAPARILLVDDNRSGLSARKAILAEFGHTVDCAEDAATGLKLFERHRYDLVITDFRMPDMDGTRFIAELRKRKPGVPIVLLSGFVEALGLNEQNTGADTVIMKNAREVHHLTSTVQRLLTAARKPPASETSSRQKAARKTSRA
ncbi:MAG: response regulator [Bryobacteraceae bacterium]